MLENNKIDGIDEIRLRVEGAVFELVINRPAYKNALNAAMYARLAELLEEAATASQCRVVLLRGAEGVFSSGNDLKDFMGQPSSDESSPAMRFLRALYHFHKPLVAAVQGMAIGSGATLLLHCDLVYAGESTAFQLPFVNLGLCPELGSSLFLSQAGGRLKATEVLLFGERFDAVRAEELGLVNRVVPDDQVLVVARERAQRLAQQPPRAVQATKRLLREPQFHQGKQVIERELAQFFQGMESAEFKEAVTAFFEKRPPEFSAF